jgi:Flp pilus assembly pilin Flp
VRDLPRRAVRSRPQSGQTMAEYALVLAVITIGVMASVSALSGGIMSGIDTVSGLVAGLVQPEFLRPLPSRERVRRPGTREGPPLRCGGPSPFGGGIERR